MEKNIHQKYLLSNQDDQKWKLIVNSVGFQSVGPGEEYPPSHHPSRYLFSTAVGRVLDEYQLIYITKGKGVFYSESLGRKNGVSVSEGSVFVLFPGEWHSYHPDKDIGWDEYWIGFSGELTKQLMSEDFFSKSNPILRTGLHSDMIEQYRNAIDAALDQKSGYHQLLYGILSHLLGAAYFYHKNVSFSNSRVMDIIVSAREIIDHKYGTVTPASVAEQLNMGYSNFRKVFKSYTGFAPAQYITGVRLSKAKEMLTNTLMPIKEIASKVGFEYFEYFFMVFKKKEGRTPTEYRNMTQGRNIKRHDTI